MASTRCLATLSSAGDFKALDVDAQAVRLVQFLSDEWFGPEPIDVINNIRFSQRLRVHAARSGMCAGDTLIGLLQEAKAMHEAGQAVHPVIQPASGRLITSVPAEAVPADIVPDIAPPPPASDPHSVSEQYCTEPRPAPRRRSNR